MRRLAWLLLWWFIAVAQATDAQSSGDRSPHRVGFVRRDGVRIHYLAWGTSGPAVVLLPGFSLTAHAFDEIGPALATDHRIIAVTPRGFGESDAPSDSAGYTIATLVEDLQAILDTLRIERAALVAHSISGTVAAHFALRHPTRVSQLVLLDSYPYYAAEGGDSVSALDSVSAPPFRGDTTYDAVAAYLGRYRYVPWRPGGALDADLRVKPLGAENGRRRALTERYIPDQWVSPPDLTRLRVPSLEVCAVPSVRSEYPWLDPTDPDYQRAQRYVTQHLGPFARRLCQRYAATVPGGHVVELPGSHYVFFTRPDAALGVLKAFLR